MATKYTHTNLIAKDWKRLLAFYQEVFGCIPVLPERDLSGIEQFQFILIFVDYNPNSSKLDLQSLSVLPFAHQVKIFFSGFAMWQQNVKPLSSYLS